MSSIFRVVGSAALLAAVALPGQAGTIEVAYDPAASYSDAGETPREREANLAALAGALQTFGPRLPGADSVLKVTLLDVDLAGSVRPARGGQPLRVLRGRADWPQIRLRYTLLEAGHAPRSGEETLSDLNYTWRASSYGGAPSEPLRHEKRLLSEWFAARILPAAATP